MPFIICSYYTLDTKYVDVAHSYLMASLQKLPELKSSVRGVENLGDWNKNTSYKATFIRLMMETYPDKNIVFLDCDAEVLQYPTLFEEIPEEYNFAIHILDNQKWYNRNSGEKEFLTGTFFIRNTPASKFFIESWERACISNSKIWEQKLFQQMIEMGNIPIYNLPLSYTYIKTLPNGEFPHIKIENPVIVHNQVSRKLKRNLNGTTL